MSPRAGTILLDSIRPIIKAALARGVVKTVGSEDLQELEADALAQAAKILDSAELAGREVSPNSVAYYVLQPLRSGRRSGYAGRADVMSPAAALDGRVTLVSMDEPVGDDLPVPGKCGRGQFLPLLHRWQFLEAAVPDNLAPQTPVARMVNVFKELAVEPFVDVADDLVGIDGLRQRMVTGAAPGTNSTNNQ